KELLLAANPSLDGMIKPMRRPPILLRDCRLEDVAARVATIADVIDAERSTAEVIAVLAHEDCDDVEPAHERVASKIKEAFQHRGYLLPPVTPAGELETWWFLWPSAVARYRPSWRKLDAYKGRQVGGIVNAKEELRRALRPPRGSYRDYRESDSPAIAKLVREMGIIRRPEASSASFDQFLKTTSALT